MNLALVRIQANAPAILAHFGGEAQLTKAVEEMAELTVELCKLKNKDAITEEIADALIMLFQMRELFDAEAVDNQIHAKLDRVLERMKK